MAGGVRAMWWPLLTLVALAWPSRVLGPLDGLPLNGRSEALLLGIVVPSLIWFDLRSLQRTPIRVAIIAILAVKKAGLMLTPQGLCARFSTTAPAPIRIFRGDAMEELPVGDPEHVHQPLIQTIVDELNGHGACASTGESGARTARVMEEILAEFRSTVSAR